MLYDINTTAEQLKAAADWSTAGETMADVELLVDDRMLVVTQGDERAAFDTGGEPGSEEYVSLAPLDRPAPHEKVPLDSIRALVDYDWSVELSDYEQQDEDGQEAHVFTHLQAIDAWLKACGR